VFAATLVSAVLSSINSWPALGMQLKTTEPIASQLTMKILGGTAAALLGALLAGLCAGVGAFGARMTPPLARVRRWPATLAAVAAGTFVGGLQAGLGALAIPDLPRWPSSGWESQASPIAGGALSGLAFISFASLELFVVYVVSRLTRGFSQRLWLAIVVVIALECAAALVQGRSNLGGALVSGVIAGVAAASVLLLLLRYDPRLVPAFAATVVVMTGAVKASQAHAFAPFAVDVVVTIAVAAWLTRYLRRDPALAA
jgi:hypothetical protein